MSAQPDLKYPTIANKPCSAREDHAHCTQSQEASTVMLWQAFLDPNPHGCWAVSMWMTIHRKIEAHKSNTPAKLTPSPRRRVTRKGSWGAVEDGQPPTQTAKQFWLVISRKQRC